DVAHRRAGGSQPPSQLGHAGADGGDGPHARDHDPPRLVVLSALHSAFSLVVHVSRSLHGWPPEVAPWSRETCYRWSRRGNVMRRSYSETTGMAARTPTGASSFP